ncbi:MAG: hypothetical protein F4X72_08755 [Dehalococcoidia bacterium]|nr:hypothetical protein [Dehalococcoidia bacterium]
MDEGFGLGQLAVLEELAHLLCEGGDGIGAVQILPSLGQHRPCLVCGALQAFLAPLQLHDVVRGGGDVYAVALRYEVPDAAQLLLHLLKLRLDALQLLTVLPGRSVHLLV